METTCQECGAPLPSEGKCLENFYALLALEHQVIANLKAPEDDRGKIAHFYAVSAYILQHPEGMGYRADILRTLRLNVANHLAGKIRLGELLHQTRHSANGSARIIRRESDAVMTWPITAWPLTVMDILQGGAEGYVERATAWAKSVIDALNEAGA